MSHSENNFTRILFSCEEGLKAAALFCFCAFMLTGIWQLFVTCSLALFAWYAIDGYAYKGSWRKVWKERWSGLSAMILAGLLVYLLFTTNKSVRAFIRYLTFHLTY